MIKEVKDIPSGPRGKSQRQQIRDDINEAIEKGIKRFEFVGDIYNYKTLQASAACEARWLTQQKLRAAFKEKRPDLKRYYLSLDAYYAKYIKTTSVKDGETRRVFCEISDENFKSALEEQIRQAEERRRSREERNKTHGEKLL